MFVKVIIWIILQFLSLYIALYSIWNTVILCRICCPYEFTYHTTKQRRRKSYAITNTNPSLASEKELMIHPIIDRYTDTIRFIVVIGGASLFDLHICVQTCKWSWDRYSWRTIIGTRSRDSQPALWLRRDTLQTHPSQLAPNSSTTGSWHSPKQNHHNRLSHQWRSHFPANPPQWEHSWKTHGIVSFEPLQESEHRPTANNY